MPDLALLAAAARSLLPSGCAVAPADPRAAAPPLWPEEALPRAIPDRQREFAAGRSAARRALASLGQPACAIPSGPDRAPVWPRGWHGTITHSATACLAAVIPSPGLIGLDLEPALPLEPELWETVLLPEEQAALALVPDRGMWAKLAFSAKEAAYKAQYLRSGTLLGYDAMAVTFAPDPMASGSFAAVFTQAVPGFARGSVLQGRFALVEGHFLTGVSQ